VMPGAWLAAQAKVIGIYSPRMALR
jgi:hypothetical protein